MSRPSLGPSTASHSKKDKALYSLLLKQKTRPALHTTRRPTPRQALYLPRRQRRRSPAASTTQSTFLEHPNHYSARNRDLPNLSWASRTNSTTTEYVKLVYQSSPSRLAPRVPAAAAACCCRVADRSLNVRSTNAQ